MQNNQEPDMYAVTTVTDDDENENNDSTIDARTATENTTAEQDRMRVAAEKRRQKILNQANTRMSIVEGTYSSSTATASNTEETKVEGGEEDSTKVEDGAEVPVESCTASTTTTDAIATDAATTTAAASTTSSKLAAMRRRRFQKKAAPPTDAVPPAEEAVNTTNVTPTSTSNPSSTDVKVLVEAIKGDGIELVEEVTNASITRNTGGGTGQDDKTETDADPKDTMDGDATTTKKYLGVAKMRRRMIKERQGQQHDAHVTSDNNPSNVPAGATTKSTTSATVGIMLPKKHRSMITTLPILAYVMTTFLLFFTGLNIGLQQSKINYCYGNPAIVTDDNADGYCYNTSNEPQWSLLVHSELAPRKMGGLQRLLSTMNIVVPDQSGRNQMIQNAEAILPVDSVVSESQNDDAEDEFSTTEATVKVQGNIDPLFQVDLDALTTGDGLYFTLGRFAVRVHRFILMVLLDTPKSILLSLVSILWSFVQTPPVLFLMAVFLRHGLGKVVLGAKLPKAVMDDAQHKDILSTVKTFVTKFVLSSFPTITIFYDVWTHIRSDMYVMLCGLFVGIALCHHHQAGSPYGDDEATTIRTMAKTVTTIRPVDGTLEEL